MEHWLSKEQHRLFELEVHEMVSKNGILGKQNSETKYRCTCSFFFNSVSNHELLQFHGSPSNIVVEPADHHEYISPFTGEKIRSIVGVSFGSSLVIR